MKRAPTLVEQIEQVTADQGGKLAALGQIGERARQLEAVQVHSTGHRDGTGRAGEALLATSIVELLDDLRCIGLDTWADELRAAFFTAAATTNNWDELRDRLLTVAGTVVNWILDGDRRGE